MTTTQDLRTIEPAQDSRDSDCPEGWALVSFTDLFDIQGGTQPPKTRFIYEPRQGYVRLLQIRDFGGKPLPTYVPLKGLLKTCEEEDILIGRYGASVGRICTGLKGAYNVALTKVDIPAHLDRNFAHRLLQSSWFQRPILGVERSAQNGFNKSDLARITLPLCPEPEQRRIMAKIRPLFQRVNASREHLEKVPTILKRFRQAILASACSGRQTADWRTRTPVEDIEETLKRVHVPASKTGREATDNIIPGVCILSVGNPHSAAPSGWRWTPLIEIAKLESGHTPSRKHPEYWGGKIPWIGILDAGAHHGRFILQTKQTVTQLGLENSAARLLPPQTVCLSRTASVGYVLIMGRTMTTSQDFVNWVCSDALVPEFLMYALMAEGEDIKRFGRGTTHTTIYFPEVKALHICLPSVSEQREIVRRIEASLALADTIKKHVAAATMRAEKLTQAILAKALRGELVPTEAELARREGRSYEPASVLLDRIRADRK